MKYYLRPMHYVDSPQQYDGMSKRLAGSLIWFTQLEIIARDADNIERQFVTLDDWDDHLLNYDENIKLRLKSLYQNIVSERKSLHLDDRVLRFDQPQVMGILNITPDSFSDGGQFISANNIDENKDQNKDQNKGQNTSDDMHEAAIEAGFAMARDGAAIIDIGGESTRPGAKVIWEGDEAARILPSVERLSAGGISLSVDTRKAMVMETALSKGAAIINDISALGYDKRSIEVVRKFNAPVIIMHAPSQGDNPHENAHYHNILYDVYDKLENRVDELVQAGLKREQIMIDVGIGFGKNLSENLNLINGLSLFHGIGCAIVFGASRKRLIGALSNEADADARLGGSLALVMKALEHGVHMVRVHDVFETVQSVRVWRGLRDAALTALV